MFFLIFTSSMIIGGIGLYYYLNKAPKKKEKTITELIDEYYEKNKKRFIEFKNHPTANENIEECLYDKQWHINMSFEENNIEKRWKTRLLNAWTPMGNIIMFYDIYKNGFAYYSNNTLTDYLLNAIALDYVRKFKCCDFYLEENNRLFSIMNSTEKKEETEIKNKFIKDSHIFTKKRVNNERIIKKKYVFPMYVYKFIYGILSIINKIKTIFIKEEVKKTREINKNIKFIKIGKIDDFTFIQIKKKGSILNGFHSEYDYLFNKQHETQERGLSYKDFKKVLNND